MFDRLDLIAGGRWDWSNAGSGSWHQAAARRAVRHPRRWTATHSTFQARAGINFRVTPEVALFTSYSESFGPIVGFGRLLDGSLPDPSEARQYEAGAKFQTSDGRLNATVATYDLTKTNIVTPISGNPTFVNQIGEARSRGVEVDVAGHLTERLQVMANYAYTDARITKDTTPSGDPGNVGHRLNTTSPFTRAASGFSTVCRRDGDLARALSRQATDGATTRTRSRSATTFVSTPTCPIAGIPASERRRRSSTSPICSMNGITQAPRIRREYCLRRGAPSSPG